MFSLRRICFCCFPLIEEDSKQETNIKENCNFSSFDLSHQLENISHSDNAKLLIKPSESPTIKLIILESQSFETGTEFTINQNGLDSSISNTGSVIIGSDPTTSQIILSNLEKGVGSQHFIIKHDKLYKCNYAIKDLGNGTGTFIRIEKKLFLKSGNIISFGDSHMMITTGDCEDNKIHLKFIDGPRKDQSYLFGTNECPVNFGRMADCSIKLDDSSLSRYHCFIGFDSGWFIKDGDGNRSSTNGTWLFCEDFIEIQNGTVFKAAETLFKVLLDYDGQDIR